MVVLLSSRGSLAEEVLCSLLAGPISLLHDAGHHLRPRPLEGLWVPAVRHPAVQTVLFLPSEFFAGQAQALLILPAGEVLLPNPSLLGLLPLPLNLRIYIHFFLCLLRKFGDLFMRPCSAYLRHFLINTLHVATSCSPWMGSVGWLWPCRYPYAQARTRCSSTSLSVSFAEPAPLPRTEDTQLVRRVRGRRVGYGHLGTRGTASRCYLQREISEVPSPSALCIARRPCAAPSFASGSCPSPAFRSQLVLLGLGLVVSNQGPEDGLVALRLASVVLAPCEAVLFAPAGVVGRHAGLPQFVPLVGVSLP